MNYLPPALDELIEAFSALPGVGKRSAERYAYSMLKKDKNASKRLAKALEELHSKVTYCKKTFALIASDQEVSRLYTDPSRDKHTVLVVAEPLDIIAIEKTGLYKGTYHVLGGLISPIDNVMAENLHIKELVKRVGEDSVAEVILATNASVEGETTALYLRQQLNQSKVKITRLAQGLPIGLDIEYADQITLGKALEGRQSL